MSRTDDDDWDITEGVGATALGVAYARSRETNAADPLFVDQHAQRFIDAAVQRGWQLPTGPMAERLSHIAVYAACRTKWFDDFFVAASCNGIRQAVILAAGLDARAWRLPWATDSTVFEIDQLLVLRFKADVLASHGVRSAARYVPVPVDLRNDWPKALRDNGFHPDEPTAWSAEGLLPYLPATAQDLLFDRVHELSAPGSRLAVEAFGANFFDPEYLAEQERRGSNVADLWYLEPRTDVADWLAGQGWTTSVISSLDAIAHYHRDVPEAVPRTDFVAAHLSS